MGLMNFVTQAFIDVFSITQPTAKERRKATLYINGLLALIVAGVLTFLSVLYHVSHR
jgi:hypothetical protein